MEPVVEGLQPVNLLPHGVWGRAGPPPVDDLDSAGQQPQHALALEPALERAHGVGMGLGFTGPLYGRAISKQDQGANHFIALLSVIDEAQLQLRKFRRRVHRSSFRWSARRGAYVPYRAGGCHVWRSATRRDWKAIARPVRRGQPIVSKWASSLGGSS